MRYPLGEPFDAGRLDVGDGQLIHYELAGKPDGKPAVMLHGGPGSGARPNARTQFDPERYLVVQFDQRGAGRSTPPLADIGTDLSVNTTAHLVADIEKLRTHLGIDRWLVYGSSWGATLAQAYLVQHADRATEVLLVAVTTTSARDVEWLTRGAGMFFPAEWNAFRNGVPAEDREGNLAAAYARLLASEDAAIREKAATDWCAWETALLSLESGSSAALQRYSDPRFRFGFARAVTHYFGNAAFLADGALLENAAGLGHIPAVLIHGRLDISGPLSTAWNLHNAWPGSELVVIDNAGHTGDGMGDAVVRATDRFAADT